MILVTGDEAIEDWLRVAFGLAVPHRPRALLGIADNDGHLRGVFVFTGRSDTTAELHVYGTVTPSTVKGMFHFVFRQLGLWRLEVRTTKRNKTVKRAAPKFGFKFEGVARHYYGPGDDALVFGMTAPDCRWIKWAH